MKLTPSASADFEPFSPARRQIAKSVTLSRRTIPSFVIDRWVETTAMDRARLTLGREIERAIGIKPTLSDFLFQALAKSSPGIRASSTAGMSRMATRSE